MPLGWSAGAAAMMYETLNRLTEFLKETFSVFWGMMSSAQLRDYGMAHQSIDRENRLCEAPQDVTPFWTNERPSKSGFY
jgi:hypothetical protein